MTEAIIVAIITGTLTLAGSIITNHRGNNKLLAELRAEMQTSQTVTEYKITELAREVRLHNNFAQRVPVLEEKIQSIERRM